MGVQLWDLSDSEIDALEYLAGVHVAPIPPIDTVACLVRHDLARATIGGVRLSKEGARVLADFHRLLTMSKELLLRPRPRDLGPPTDAARLGSHSNAIF
jgi:hypothetical protein